MAHLVHGRISRDYRGTTGAGGIGQLILSTNGRSAVDVPGQARFLEAMANGSASKMLVLENG